MLFIQYILIKLFPLPQVFSDSAYLLITQFHTFSLSLVFSRQVFSILAVLELTL